MTIEQIVFAAITAVLGLVTLTVTIRNWIYGGSVVKVELALGRRDVWGATVFGSVNRWAHGDTSQLKDVGTQAVDVVQVTVRNLGRTPSTIIDVGLLAGRPPVPSSRTMVMPTQLLEPGVQSMPIRIEAHDAKIFYFHMVPMVSSARSQFPTGPIALTAAVATGTGRIRRSGRWRDGKWNVWVVKAVGDVSITGAPLSTAEFARLWFERIHELVPMQFISIKSIIDVASKLADAGASAEGIHEELKKVAKIQALTTSDSGSVDVLIYSLADQLVRRRDGLRPASLLAVPGTQPTEPEPEL